MNKTISISKMLEDSIRVMQFFAELFKDYEFSFEIRKKGKPIEKQDLDEVTRRITEKVGKYSVHSNLRS